MKVIGYIRVSSEKQVKEGYSLTLQRTKIEEYCKFKDNTLIDIYEDKGISGMSIDKRDGYKDMVEYLNENDIDGVVVWSLSRLGRKMKDVISFLDHLKKCGKSFYSIKENIGNDDKIGSLIMNILSSINEFEVETIRERIKDVKTEKKNKGLVYGREKYGFNNVDGKLMKNKYEFNIIKRIKNLRSRGWSWRRISLKLNEDNIKSKDGGVWYDGSLYNMMRMYA
jgi:site-specific DNA recombinase|tara:strand:- start:1831 stop:2502 length:672 start_codon:yes stop_codon:yes gene_type:complete